jgi:hypothetical protein
MKYRTGTRYDYTTYDFSRSTRKASLQNFIGASALTFIALACGYTMYANVFGADIYPAMLSANVEPVTRARTHQVSFAERFEPMVGAPAATVVAATVAPKNQNTTVALLDPNLLGSAPGSFKAKAQPAAAAATASAETLTPQDVMPLPAVAQLVPSVPLPVKRPSDARLAQNNEPSLREITQASRAMAVANASAPKPTIFDKLFGKPQKPTVLAYAGSDGGVFGDGSDKVIADSPMFDRQTAVYDITARTVYMPDGTRLEAHSGLREHIDDPRYVHLRMRGATPPHVYDLTPRESLFHGVAAIRLNPVGGERAIHGRTGLLAHTYMLGPNGDSNGCVSFKDYNAFLRAFRNGDIKRLAVVAKVE